LPFTNVIVGNGVPSGALCAQSPFAGTWKLDMAKTKYDWRAADRSDARN
jgi:hypothetical protein